MRLPLQKLSTVHFEHYDIAPWKLGSSSTCTLLPLPASFITGSKHLATRNLHINSNMTRTKGRKTSRARRKEEPLASSTVNKSASSKDDIKSSSSGTTDKLATSNTIDEAVDRKKSRKTKKSRKRRMIAALYQPQTASTSAMVLRSASSNKVEEPAVSDTAATSRVAAPRSVVECQPLHAELT
jgi:hypothetical protein